MVATIGGRSSDQITGGARRLRKALGAGDAPDIERQAVRQVAPLGVDGEDARSRCHAVPFVGREHGGAVALHARNANDDGLRGADRQHGIGNGGFRLRFGRERAVPLAVDAGIPAASKQPAAAVCAHLVAPRAAGVEDFRFHRFNPSLLHRTGQRRTGRAAAHCHRR